MQQNIAIELLGWQKFLNNLNFSRSFFCDIITQHSRCSVQLKKKQKDKTAQMKGEMYPIWSIFFISILYFDISPPPMIWPPAAPEMANKPKMERCHFNFVTKKVSRFFTILNLSISFHLHLFS